MAFVIDRGACNDCGWCAEECPTGAIGRSFGGGVTYAVDVDWCIDCAICARVCAMDCFSYRPGMRPAAAQLELAKQRARDFARRRRAAAKTAGEGTR